MAGQPFFATHKGLKITGIVIAGIFVLGIISSIVNPPKKAASTGATTTTAAITTTTATTVAPAPTVPPTAPPTTPAPTVPPPTAFHTQTVFSQSGEGIHTTQKFDVPTADWDLTWSYNCASYGGQGNFQVYVNGGDGTDAGVNELNTSGSGVEHYYDGGNTFYLEMNSECAWNVKVLTAA